MDFTVSGQPVDLMLRAAQSRDIPVLVDLMKQLGYEIDRDHLLQNLKLYDQGVIVSEIDGKVVGCIAFDILPLFHSKELQMRIVSLVVEEASRKNGIGKKLMIEAEKIALRMGCSAIELTSAAHRLVSGAHQFYHDLGYTSNGEKIYFRKILAGKNPEE